MNYTATYDPSLDNKGMTYDVDIIVKKAKMKFQLSANAS